MRLPFSHRLGLASFSAALVLGFSAATAQASCETSVAVISGAIGHVERHQNGRWGPAERGDPICAGGAVRTGENASATVLVEKDGQVLVLDELTKIVFGNRIDGYLDRILFELGRTFFLSGDDVRTEIVTPHVNGGIEGTEFLIGANIDGKLSLISVYDGKVRAKSRTGNEEVLLLSGDTVVAGDDQTFRVLDPNRQNDVAVWRPLVRPIDAVAWVLYYHPILQSDAGAELLRIQNLLTSGQVDEAKSALEALPASADQLALKTIIAVVQAQQPRERLAAIEWGREAVALDPKSPAANIALSYALQGNGDLENARSLMRRHVDADATSPIAAVRLAELELSLGHTRRAERLAKRAIAEDGRISRAHAVLGFIALARIQLSSAYEHFEKAIDLDNGDPAPRLGKGLTFIRDGNVKEGRKHLQISVALDPNQSLTRSYLGRAYFEEGEWDEAIEEYERAKQLDPQDPTPWFYQGIWELANHRLMPAYRALKKSNALNDNRQVYRSKESLAQDRAARGAITGGVFHELGLEEFGRAEALRAIHADPSNHAAHRQFADLLGEDQRFETARARENLKAKLSQPLTKDVIPPRLEESELTFLGGTGFQKSGPGEYSSLFENDGFRASFNGGIGSNQTYADELLIGILEGRVSLNLGQFRYKTDGFRENNDIQHDILTAFAQAELSEKLSVQGEFRYRETDQGDIILNFDPSDFSKDNRRKQITRQYRLGARFAPNPENTLLVNVADIKFSTDGLIVFPIADTQNHVVRSIKSIQANYVWQPSDTYSLETGIHYSSNDSFSDSDSDLSSAFGGVCPPTLPGCIFKFFEERDVNRLTSYAYNRFEFLDSILLTAGLSFNNLNRSPLSSDLLLPSFSVEWHPTEQFSLSAAYRSSLSHNFSLDHSLEPSAFSGSEVSFDTPNFTRNELVSASISYTDGDLFLDWKFAQASESLAFISSGMNSYEKGVHDQLTFELGASYALDDNWIVSFDPNMWRSEFDRTIVSALGGPNTPSSIRTTEIPISIALKGKSHFSGSVTGTYVNQKITFDEIGTSISDPTENFFLLDSEIKFRVPNSSVELNVSANNLLNKGFRFQQPGFLLPVAETLRFVPERTVFVGAKIRF